MYFRRTAPPPRGAARATVSGTLPRAHFSSRLLTLILASLAAPVFAQPSGREPGGLLPTYPALEPEPGTTLPWEGSSGATNTGNGNKLTTLPLVGWGAKGAVDVSLSLHHDSQGQGVSSVRNALNQTTSYAYNADNQRTGVTDATGRSATATFDPLGRKTGVTAGGLTTSYAYDRLGRLTGVTLPGGRVTGYAYDAGGNVTGVTNALSQADTYAYDASGRKTSETVNLGTPTTFTYDNAGRMLTAVAPNGTTGYAYDSAGRLVTTAYPNGATEDRYYHATTGDLSETWHRSSGGGVTLAKFTYGYDGLGRKVSEAQPSGVTVAYAYDAAGQLTTETRSGANAFAASYTYDNAGNRLTKTVGGVTETYAYDDANKLLSAGGKAYTYDLAGNVTGVTSGGVTTTVTWDGAGRMTGVSGGGLSVSNASVYNGLGQRIARTDSSGTRSFTLSGDAIDAPVLSDGAATYQRGLDLISETRSGASKFFHLDSLGTARALSDASGAKTDALETDAFGNVVSAVGTPLGARPFGFAARHGYQSDADTGLQRLGHRFYDPSTAGSSRATRSGRATTGTPTATTTRSCTPTPRARWRG
jgi:YD repeat-containing protein